MRKEFDGLGEVLVPDTAYWGASTQRRLQAYYVNDRVFNDLPQVVRALAEIKKACAKTNMEIGMLEPHKAQAIMQACDEVVDGQFQGQFPVDAWVSHGTGANMNVNEVIANRANELLTGHKGSEEVHPNTHVNMCQSSNDVYPTAENIVLYREIDCLIKQYEALDDLLGQRAMEFNQTVRLGRTCLQDAVPMTFGQLFGGWQCMVRRHLQALKSKRDGLSHVALTATVLGTGIGLLPGFKQKIFGNLSEVLGFEVQLSQMKEEVIKDSALFDESQNCDGFMVLMGVLKGAATALGRIAADVLLFSSGPKTGFHEFILDQSIGEDGIASEDVPEIVLRVKQQVCIAEQIATFAVNNDDLDLAVTTGSTFINVLEALKLLQKATELITERMLRTVKVNAELTHRNAEYSTSLATMASSLFGYPMGTKIAHAAFDERISCKQVCLREGLLPPEVADDIFDVKKMCDADEMVSMVHKYNDLRIVQ